MKFSSKHTANSISNNSNGKPTMDTAVGTKHKDNQNGKPTKNK